VGVFDAELEELVTRHGARTLSSSEYALEIL
jgi:hypothetical protein